MPPSLSPALRQPVGHAGRQHRPRFEVQPDIGRTVAAARPTPLPFGYLSGLPLALLGRLALALHRLELRFGLLTMLLQRIVGAVRRDGLFWIGSGNVMLDA